LRLFLIFLSLAILSFCLIVIVPFLDKYLFNTLKGIVAAVETSDLNADEINLLPTTNKRLVELRVYSSGQYQQVITETQVDFTDFIVAYDPKAYDSISLKFYDTSGKLHQIDVVKRKITENFLTKTYYEIKYYINNVLQTNFTTYYAWITIQYENRTLSVIAHTVYTLNENLDINRGTITTYPSSVDVIVKYQGIYGGVVVKVYRDVVATLSGKNLYFLPNDGSDGSSVVDVRTFYIEPGLYRIKVVKNKYVTRDFYTILTQYLGTTVILIVITLAGILIYSYRR